MRIAPACERLREAGLVRVAGALEFAGLLGKSQHLPARFVVPLDFSARPSGTIGLVDQALKVSIGVVSLLAPAKAGAEKESDEVEAEVRRVREALVGWTHPDASGPFEIADGRLMDVNPSALTWLSTFSAPARFRKDTE